MRVCVGVDLLVEQPLSVETLSSLVELTRFETLTPRFSATVPPCWVEVQQEQQQRRHPQHLHQQHHGDAAQHTRTWKLQSDRYAHVCINPVHHLEPTPLSLNPDCPRSKFQHQLGRARVRAGPAQSLHGRTRGLQVCAQRQYHQHSSDPGHAAEE